MTVVLYFYFSALWSDDKVCVVLNFFPINMDAVIGRNQISDQNSCLYFTTSPPASDGIILGRTPIDSFHSRARQTRIISASSTVIFSSLARYMILFILLQY